MNARVTAPVILSRANRTLLLPAAGAIPTMFPSAPRLDLDGAEFCAIPHDTRSYILLRRLGMANIQNPMLAYYDWPGVGTPFSVQKATCALMTSHTRAYVLNDYGTGKTRTALWSWDWLNKTQHANKLLVVCPLSTINFTWASEVTKTLPGRRVAVLHGDKKKRLARLNDPDADVFIINHDGVKTIYDEIRQMAQNGVIDTLVIDELAVYRNNSDRSKLMRKLAKEFTWVWGMTGSPMPNEPTDVWGQAMILSPHTVPDSQTHCKHMLMTQLSTHKWFPKPDAIERAFSMLQPAVRFSLDDVVELPDLIERHIDIDLTDEQKIVYKTLADAFVAMVQGKEITAFNAAVAMTKLLQVSLGWVYAGDFGTVALDAQPRVKALLDIIEANAHKVIVFVPFRHAVEGLAQVFKKEKVDYAMVHGDVSQGARERIFNLFQNTDKYKVLIAHPQCMAHGLTLTAADTIVWYCPTTSLEIYEQANARIRRVGQAHKQQVLHLQSTPVEKKIYGLLRSKQGVQDQLLAMFEEASMENKDGQR